MSVIPFKKKSLEIKEIHSELLEILDNFTNENTTSCIKSVLCGDYVEELACEIPFDADLVVSTTVYQNRTTIAYSLIYELDRLSDLPKSDRYYLYRQCISAICSAIVEKSLVVPEDVLH